MQCTNMELSRLSFGTCIIHVDPTETLPDFLIVIVQAAGHENRCTFWYAVGWLGQPISSLDVAE